MASTNPEQQCTLECTVVDKELIDILKEELKINIDLEVVYKSNIGWFTDKSISPSLLDEWQIDDKFGIYFLWHKADYCNTHELYLMDCLYIGKGNILNRIKNHYENKDFKDYGLIYFTYFEIINRHAKYIEQLHLDFYDIPYNKQEKKGEKKLRIFLTQIEVD